MIGSAKMLSKASSECTASNQEAFTMFSLRQYDTSSTAQGSGASFRIGNLEGSLVVVNHGWQSESADGLKGG